jgi:hypothetical protein
MAVCGAGTAWDDNIGPESAGEPGRRVLLVEVFNCPDSPNGAPTIAPLDAPDCWLRPHDYDASRAMGGAGKLADAGIEARHAAGVLVACADGRVWMLPKDLPVREFAAALTTQAGEPPDWSNFSCEPRLMEPVNPLWGRLAKELAIPVWFVLAVLLLYRARQSGMSCRNRTAA